MNNLALVRFIARRYAFGGRELDDLVKEGTLGLIKPAEQYDSALGVAFSSVEHDTLKGLTRSLPRDKGRLGNFEWPSLILHERCGQLRPCSEGCDARHSGFAP